MGASLGCAALSRVGFCRCLAMYISHAILFLQFYLDAFCKEYRSGEATFLTFFDAFAVIGLVKLVAHEQCWRLFADVRKWLDAWRFDA